MSGFVLTAPMWVVDAPALAPYQTGLLAALPVVEHDVDAGDRSWATGLRWRPESAAVPEVAPVFASPQFLASQTSPATGGVNALDSAVPFLVATREIDSAFGFGAADYVGRAERRLAVVETVGVEQVLELDPLGLGNAHLADGAACTVLNGGAVVGARDALALLDEAIARAQIGMGVIMAPPYLAAQWITLNQFEPADDDDDVVQRLRDALQPTSDGPLTQAQLDEMMPSIVTLIAEAQIARPMKFQSPGGNLIVCGAGFVGHGPDGSGPPGDTSHAFQWGYCTDMMRIHRSKRVFLDPPLFEQALDKYSNTVAYRVYRPYAIAWSRNLLAGVKINTATPVPVLGGATPPTSAVLIAAGASSTQTRTIVNPGVNFLLVVTNITTASAGNTVTVQINGVTASGTVYPMLTGSTVAAPGVNVLRVGPSLTPVANATSNDELPPTIQIVVTVAGAPVYGVDTNLSN